MATEASNDKTTRRVHLLMGGTTAIAVVLGGWLGWEEWGGLIGIGGGAFIGLIIGIALIYSITLISLIPLFYGKKGRALRKAEETRAKDAP